MKRRHVVFWFFFPKAYVTLRGEELRAAVKAASRAWFAESPVMWPSVPQAASAGIDNVAHGLPCDTFLLGKQTDVAEQ